MTHKSGGSGTQVCLKEKVCMREKVSLKEIGDCNIVTGESVTR